MKTPTQADPPVALHRLVRLESALAMALHILAAQEPPADSRAVSDEFVAMAAVLAGCENVAAMEIIAAGMKIPRKYIARQIEITSLPNVRCGGTAAQDS